MTFPIFLEEKLLRQPVSSNFYQFYQLQFSAFKYIKHSDATGNSLFALSPSNILSMLNILVITG